MFVDAIAEVSKFTKPIYTISRNFKDPLINRGAATLFFVNDNGVAVTCKHVIELIAQRQFINEQYDKFKAEKQAIGKNNNYIQRMKALELAYKLKEGAIIQLRELFMGVTKAPTINFRYIPHPKYDLAILIFENFKDPLYQGHARFLKDGSSLRQGKSLCRLGYPFPEFTNYQYNAFTEDIEWTNTGKMDTPIFPMDGMLTRHIMMDGEIMGVELSTPGLRGQSGGPLFTRDGRICGMQSMTNHLHLGFDMKDFEYKANGHPIKVTNQPFLHVGHCIHVDIIKSFLAQNGIRYQEE